MTELASGATLGRYRIVRPLGAGAMGVVYLAQDPQIERLLAIKTVRPMEGLLATSREAEERHQRLLREARTVGRLIHPNIVTLFDAGDQDGLLYLAFEYVEGPSLDQRLRAGEPVTTAEALRIAREAADGLAYAHARGVVHRDVKPANLLLAADGRVKISDFGIAKVVGQATELTMTGTVVGSPHYLSPEQVRGEELDGRSDLFSLGVVLYEMLEGRRPFEGETLTTLVYQILHQEPPPLELRPELDPEPGPKLSETLARLLAKDRDQRFADGREVVAALAALERTLPAEVLAAPAVVAGDVEPTRLVTLTGAVPAAAATRPSEVAGEPAATRAAAGAGGPPPPPPLPAAASAPAAIPAATPAGAAPGRSRRLLVALGLVLLVLVAAGGVVAVLGVRAWHRIYGTGAARVAALEAAQGEAGASAEPTVPPTGAPSAEPAAGEGEAARAVKAGPPPASAGKPPTEGARGPAPIPAPAPAPARPPDRAPEPAPDRERPATRNPAPTEPRGGSGPGAPAGGGGEAAASEAAGGAPAGSPAEPVRLSQAVRENPELRREVRELRAEQAAGEPAVDQKLDTGLRLSLQVQPRTAFVLLDGTVIGRAGEYEPGKSPYVLPGAGIYLLKLRAPGMEDYRVLVRASAGGPAATVVAARLAAATAAELDLGDLELHRVREAIGFEAYPPNAEVLVDGQSVGRASRYPGRFARGATWLQLGPGRHRVSVTAPGFRRKDFAVDVSAGASEARERIEVRLAPVE